MSALSLTSASPGQPFVHHVVGDTMVPTYRPRTHAVFCMPVTRYEGDGIYLIDGTELYRCQKRDRKVKLWRDNELYPQYEVDLDTFNDAHLSMVIADITIRNHDAMRSIL